MLYLADPKVLLRFADRSHPLHPVARAAVQELRAQGHRFQATSQNFVAFWNVLPRLANRNGFGLFHANADRLLRLVEQEYVPLWRIPRTRFQIERAQHNL